MPKNPELVVRLDKPILRETGYMYYTWSQKKGEIDGVYRAKMGHGRNKKQKGA